MTPPLRQLERLTDRFELGKVLGQGGFGVVRQARCRRTGVVAAAKVLHQKSTPEEAVRIFREVTALKELRSPYLVALIDLVRADDGGLVLVYELVPGQPLDALLTDSPLPLPQVLPWLSDLAEALDVLHGAGLVHRDVKAENAILEPCGRVRLLDYGLVRGLAEGNTLTQEGFVVGTPASMAPEQFQGSAAGPAADTYALGCLAYRCLLGRSAYSGEVAEIVPEKLNRGSLPWVPAGYLGECLHRVLARDPTQRYPSPRAFVRALASEPAKPQVAPSGDFGATLVVAALPEGNATPPKTPSPRGPKSPPRPRRPPHAAGSARRQG